MIQTLPIKPHLPTLPHWGSSYQHVNFGGHIQIIEIHYVEGDILGPKGHRGGDTAL